MRVVGYVRLSRDEDRESYSSILSQKSIIEEYALQHNWTVLTYYEDDNCSGYSFDRPAFNQLIKAMEDNCFDIVIAKDLSRIGRHNAYTLLFLDKVKKLNKRLILPKEGNGYDSMADESDLLGITTWYNEMYVKDISRKIKSSIKAKQKEGHMIIKEVFGYQKSPKDKHKLEIDLEAADIVQKIYKLYLSGLGYRKIADALNHVGCPTPSKYHQYKVEGIVNNCKTAEAWNSVHVQRILKNDIYIGTLRLGKTVKKAIKGKSQKQPEELQYIFENNHPAIINKEQFDEVQRIAAVRKKDHTKGAASLENIFSGLIYCKSCGSYMIAYKKQGKPKSYICGSYHKYGRKGCMRHTVLEEVLQQAIRCFMIEMINGYTEEIKSIQLNMNRDSSDNKQQLINMLLHQWKEGKKHLKQLIKQKIIAMENEKSYANQDILRGSYDELEEELNKRLIYIDNRIKELQQNSPVDAVPRQLDSKEILIDMLSKPVLARKYMDILIDKILIDTDGSPTIYMKANFDALWVRNREDVNLVPDL